MSGDSMPSECIKHFRILDLPPELRNTIFEIAFAPEVGLAPHAVTRINKQLRKESLDLFYDERTKISINLKTPEQMTRLLHWFSYSSEKDTDKVRSFTIKYNHPINGECRVELHREIVTPSKIVLNVIANMHKDGRFTKYSSATVEMRNNDIGYATWRACNGIMNNPLFATYCLTYDRDLAEPPKPFWDAVMDGSEWISYRVELIDNVTHRRCFCSPHLKFLAKVLRALNGRDWQDNMLVFRGLASGLYKMSIKAGVEKNKAEEEALLEMKEEVSA